MAMSGVVNLIELELERSTLSLIDLGLSSQVSRHRIHTSDLSQLHKIEKTMRRLIEM